MATYRKKPVAIEAERVTELVEAFRHDWQALPGWVKAAYEGGTIVALTPMGFTIKTLEGDMEASKGDMLIRGVQGEIYPCKADIFDATYEPVVPGPPNPPRSRNEVA